MDICQNLHYITNKIYMSNLINKKIQKCHKLQLEKYLHKAKNITMIFIQNCYFLNLIIKLHKKKTNSWLQY